MVLLLSGVVVFITWAVPVPEVAMEPAAPLRLIHDIIPMKGGDIMYDVLCHLGDLFFQGLLTSLFMLLLAWWYEKRITAKKARVAALFIFLELYDHRSVLTEIIERKEFPAPNDDDYCFCARNWDEFKNNLVPLLRYKDLKDLASYYQSINLILAMMRRSEPYSKNTEAVASCLDDAAYFCVLLGNLADFAKNQDISQR